MSDKIKPSAAALDAVAEIEARMRADFQKEVQPAPKAEAPKASAPVEPMQFEPPQTFHIRERGILDASRQKVERPRVNGRSQHVTAPSADAMRKGDLARAKAEMEALEAAKERQELLDSMQPERLAKDLAAKTRIIEATRKKVSKLEKTVAELRGQIAAIRENNL